MSIKAISPEEKKIEGMKINSFRGLWDTASSRCTVEVSEVKRTKEGDERIFGEMSQNYRFHEKHYTFKKFSEKYFTLRQQSQAVKK